MHLELMVIIWGGGDTQTLSIFIWSKLKLVKQFAYFAIKTHQDLCVWHFHANLAQKPQLPHFFLWKRWDINGQIFEVKGNSFGLRDFGKILTDKHVHRSSAVRAGVGALAKQSDKGE